MALASILIDLDRVFVQLEATLRSYLAEKPVPQAADQFHPRDEYVLEGVLSRVWQAWSSFNRSCLIESCLGTTSATGVAIPAVRANLSSGHVSKAAIDVKAARFQRSPSWNGTNALLRREPTWGDVDVLNGVVRCLQPRNSAQLLAALSSVSQHAKTLQCIRNAAAHANTQTLSEVRARQSAYVSFPIGEAAHALLWLSGPRRDYLLFHAMEELRTAADAAIQ
jgi:hypothetical protein